MSLKLEVFVCAGQVTFFLFQAILLNAKRWNMTSVASAELFWSHMRSFIHWQAVFLFSNSGWSMRSGLGLGHTPPESRNTWAQESENASMYILCFDLISDLLFVLNLKAVLCVCSVADRLIRPGNRHTEEGNGKKDETCRRRQQRYAPWVSSLRFWIWQFSGFESVYECIHSFSMAQFHPPAPSLALPLLFECPPTGKRRFRTELQAVGPFLTFRTITTTRDICFVTMIQLYICLDLH